MLLSLTILFWLGSAVLVGMTAQQHGRSFLGWSLLAIGLSPLVALMALLFVPARPATKDTPLLGNPVTRIKKGVPLSPYTVEQRRASTGSLSIGPRLIVRLTAVSSVLVAMVIAGMTWYASPSSAGSRASYAATQTSLTDPVVEDRFSIYSIPASASPAAAETMAQAVPTEWSGEVLTLANLRSGPGTEYEVVGILATGTQVQIKGLDRAEAWYKLQNDAWISAPLVDVSGGTAGMMVVAAPASTPTATTLDEAPTVNTLIANLRTGPGTDYAIHGKAPAGQKLALVGVSPDGDWYELNNGTWIYAQLVDNAPTGLALSRGN